MNNEEFLETLQEANRDCIMESVSLLYDALGSFRDMADGLTYMVEDWPDLSDILISDTFNRCVPSTFSFKPIEDAIFDIRASRDAASSYLKIENELKKINFSKLPIRYTSGPNENKEFEDRTVSLEDVLWVSADSKYGYTFRIKNGDLEENSYGLNLSFDTKDPEITNTLNQAGFYTYDQVQKIKHLDSLHENNKNSAFLNNMIDLWLYPKPQKILEREIEAFSKTFAMGHEYASNSYETYNELLPVPIEKSAFRKMMRNHFMDPVELITDKEKMPDYVDVFAKIGNVTIDFIKEFGGHDISVTAFVPESSLNKESLHEISTYSCAAPDYHQVYNPDTKNVEYMNGYLISLTRDVKDLNIDLSELKGENGKKLMQSIIQSPEVKKTLTNSFPVDCFIKDFYKINEPVKELQR